MKVKTKLLGNNALNIVVLLGILAGCLYIFHCIDNGAVQINNFADTGKNKAEGAHSSIVSADKDLALVLNKSTSANTTVQKANSQIKILQHKIKTIAATLTDLSELAEDTLDKIDDEVTADILTDIADELSDVQEIMKREALVSLQSSVKSMDESNNDLIAQVSLLSGITKKLDKAKDLSGKSGQASEEIKTVSSGFRQELIRNRNFLVGIIAIAAICALMLGLIITRSILIPLGSEPEEMVRVADGIAKGNLDISLKLVEKGTESSVAGAMRRMVKNLKEKGRFASTIAEGDLSNDVPLASNKDILGLAFQRMSQSLKELLTQMKTSGANIDSSSAMIGNASQILAQGATEQVISLTDIANSIEQISVQINQNVDNSRTADQLSSEAQQAAQQGSQQMESMVQSMREIDEASQNISKIIKTIDEIAFQTNLLALNAAVEAARAGQHGKGFAVVAEEVRSLAARSATAARETTEIIELSIAKAKKGNLIANKTAESLNTIVHSITRTSDLVTEISAISNKQIKGIERVNQGLSQLNQVAQQNTASAEETAATAELLSCQAAQSKQILQQFKTTENTSQTKQLTDQQHADNTFCVNAHRAGEGDCLPD